MPDKSQLAERPTDKRNRMLVNDLTVRDAWHLLATEGGPLDASQLVVRGISIAVVATACAYAIWAGHATVWHLALPMAGRVFHPALGDAAFVSRVAASGDAEGCRRVGAVVGDSVDRRWIALAVQSYRNERPWTEQLSSNIDVARNWIRDHKIHWAILAAMSGMLLELPGRLANFRKYGPPFSPLGLGCGMRIAVLSLACFLLQFVMSGTATRNAWILLGLLVLAEVLTLVMHLDIQKRLAKMDG